MRTIALRYAKAFYSCAQASNSVDEVVQAFQKFMGLIDRTPEFRRLLQLPFNSDREKILSDLLKRDFSEIFLQFLFLILKNKRGHFLEEIFEALLEHQDIDQDRIEVKVTTVIPLGRVLSNQIEKKLGRILQKKVRLQNLIDPLIIGGAIFRLNGQKLDESVQEYLYRLQHYLIQN